MLLDYILIKDVNKKMNAKEKYNDLIRFIEYEVTKENPKGIKRISEAVYLKYGYNLRELNSIFNFLTDKTLLQYIRERKLVATYTFLRKCDDWKFGLQMALLISDSNDQSALNNKFKELFGKTTKEIFNDKNDCDVPLPLFWDDIQNVKFVLKNEVSKNNINKMKFGLSIMEYNRLLEASEMQNIYELDDKSSEIAYYISTKMCIPVKLAFDFVYECGCCDITTNYDLNALLSVDKLYVYVVMCNGNLGLNYISEFLKIAYNYKFDIRSLTIDPDDMPEIEYVYEKNTPYTVFELLLLADKYNKEKQKHKLYVDFEEFVFNVSFGMDYKDAILSDEILWDIEDMTRIYEQGKNIFEEGFYDEY